MLFFFPARWLLWSRRPKVHHWWMGLGLVASYRYSEVNCGTPVLVFLLLSLYQCHQMVYIYGQNTVRDTSQGRKMLINKNSRLLSWIKLKLFLQNLLYLCHFLFRRTSSIYKSLLKCTCSKSYDSALKLRNNNWFRFIIALQSYKALSTFTDSFAKMTLMKRNFVYI